MYLNSAICFAVWDHEIARVWVMWITDGLESTEMYYN